MDPVLPVVGEVIVEHVVVPRPDYHSIVVAPAAVVENPAVAA